MQDLNLAAGGFETGSEPADDAALKAEPQIRRAVLKQAGQTETAALSSAHLGGDQYPALRIERHALGQAGRTAQSNKRKNSYLFH